MKPWEVIGRARAPDGTALTLTRHPSGYLIQADGHALMSSWMHDSEDALALLGCQRARTLPHPAILIGGLGMGFTVRAALDILPPGATIVVAELLPEVVEWNRGPLGTVARRPLDDVRVRVEVADVGDVMGSGAGRFDAILLDVDNGAEALTVASNAGLYDARGLAVLRRALRPDGVLAVWCERDDRRFERRLRAAGFRVQREHARGRPVKRGPRFTILVAERREERTGRPRLQRGRRAACAARTAS